MTGSLYDNFQSGSPPNESVENESSSFAVAGTIARGKLTVNFTGGSAPVFGELSANTVRLEVPQNDGSLPEDISLKPPPGSATLP